MPLMPGVLLTEAMAQTSGWLVIGMLRFTRMPFLAALKQVKFRTFVTPGQRLTINARLVHEGSGYAIADADIEIDGEPICDANITFRVVDFPNPTFVTFMKEFAGRIEFPMDTLA
jgi:3-hydroxyacyl-[acyl-carrier-protein] dehydratase